MTHAMNPEMMRAHWSNFSPMDKRLHLAVDHRYLPGRLGGDESKAWVLDEPDNSERLDELHDALHEGNQGEGWVSHQHRPPVGTLPEPVPAEGLSVSFDGEAWEVFYGVLDALIKSETAVQINDGPTMQLVEREGDLMDAASFFYARPWQEATTMYDGPLTAFRLYTDEGVLTVQKITVL